MESTRQWRGARAWTALTLAWALTSCRPGPVPKPAIDAATAQETQAPLGAAAPLTLAVETTPTALHTTFAMPRGDVARPTMGAVGFSQPMVALGALDTPTEVSGVTLSPKVPLHFQWLSTDTLAWYPDAPLPGSTAFEVSVGEGLRSLSGAKLAEPLRWTFRTPPVALQQTWPGVDQGDIGHQAAVVLVFSQQIDPQSLRDRVRVQGPGQASLGFKLGWPKGPALRAVRQARWPQEAASTDAAFEGRLALVEPRGSWPAAAQIEVAIDPGLHSLEGPLPTTQPLSVSFKTHGPFAVVDATCEDGCRPDRYAPVRVRLSNAVSGRYLNGDVDKLIAISPPLKGGEVHCWNAQCEPAGQFEPGRRYTLTISAELEDVHGQHLGRPFVYTFTTGLREPALTFATDGSIIEPAETKTRLGLQLVNIDQLTVRAHRLDRGGLASALDDNEETPALAGAAPFRYELTLPIAPSRKQDASEIRMIDVASVLGHDTSGLFVIDASSPQDKDPRGAATHHRRLFQVTDLHIDAKVSEVASLFWVTSLASGKPVAGAQVEVQGEAGHILWRGVTDASGLCQGVGGLWRDGQNVPVVVASLGTDAALLRLTESQRVDLGVSGLWPVWESPPAHRIAIYTDKNLYRLGDTVHINAIVRAFAASGLQIPRPGEALKVEVLDPADRVISTATPTLSAQGTLATSALIPAFGTYGRYEVRVSAGNDRESLAFSVSVYRAPKFESGVTVSGAHHVQGEQIDGATHASYYTGGALAGAAARVSAYGTPAVFAPPGWDKLRFGVNTAESDAPGAQNYLSQEAKGRTDERGAWAFRLGTTLAMNTPLQVEVESTIEDPNGRTVSAQTTFWLHPAAWSIGLGMASSVVRAGTPLRVDVAAVRPEGAAFVGAAIHLQLLSREWKSVREKAMNGEFIWRTQRVDSEVGQCDVVSAATTATCTLTPNKAGSFVVIGSAKDAAGHSARSTLSLYATGSEDVAWNPSEDDTPMLIADKVRYDVGDVAHILVKNPIPGAVALITEERDRVLQSRLQTLPTSTEMLDVPITAAHVPNVYVAVALFSGRRAAAVTAGQDTGAPSLQLGYVQLAVDPQHRHLAVQVTPATTRARPGQEVVVDVLVRNAQGQGRPAEVTLMAVDEGVLALTRHATPDPFAQLYAAVPLAVRNYGTIGELVRARLEEDKGETGGGGGGSSSGTRSRFADVAFYAANLQADAQGHLSAHVTLPDNLTRYRLMAIAVDGAEQFGSGEAAIQVDKPLMLLTSFPRTVQIGDHFEAAATLRHGGTTAATGTLTCQVGAGLRLLQGDEQTFTLLPGSSVEKTCQVQATAAGKSSITFAARIDHASAEGDSVQEGIEVLDPHPLESVASYGVAAGPVDQLLLKASAIDPKAGGLHFSAASTGMVGLEQGLQWLIAYPYSCTEQLSSQLLALLQVDKLSKTFHLLPDQAAKGPALIDNAIGRILERRSASQEGAFALWPQSNAVEPAATAWALWVLWQAQAQGHAVDAEVLAHGAAWLRARLPQDQRAHFRSQAAFDSERAMDLAVLSRLGQSAPAYLDDLFARRTTLSRAAQLWLGEALAWGDGAKGTVRAGQLLGELTRALHIDGETAHLPEVTGDGNDALWSSEVRTNAMLLDLMATITPEHPLLPRLARWLVQRRQNDRYATTQENAWALHGLLGYFNVAEQQAPAFTFRALLGDRVLAEGGWHARSLESTHAFLSQADLPAGPTPLHIARQGKGPLYYSLRYDYAPTRESQGARNAGLLVRRTMLDQRGATAVAALRRGEQVLVTLTVLADTQHDFVSVVDEVPAGLEPVDFDLSTASHDVLRRLATLARGRLGADSDDSEADLGSENSGCDHRELAGHEVRFFVDHLTAGVHTFTYVARAAVRGQFSSHGARAEAMYNPEVFGTSGPTAVVVE